jgi:hypothetical protein
MEAIPLTLSDAKRARALKQIELLEAMISGIDRDNESEAEHGKFEAMKTKIMNKCRIVESLLGEEHAKPGHLKHGEQEDQITLAKRMDRELQL